MSGHQVDESRRKMLIAASSTLGGIAVAGAAIPFAASMQPSAKTTAAGAPVAVDLEKIGNGELKVIEWRRKPVWVLRRDVDALATLAKVEADLRDPTGADSVQPEYVDKRTRAQRPEWLVLLGVCTHLGCSPKYRPDKAPADLGPAWLGGFLCPCHGGRYDLSGRVFKGVPPPKNLEVPPYRFDGDTRLVIGVDPEKA